MTDPVDHNGFRTLHTTDDAGRRTSSHLIPAEQFVHSIDEEASCLCGPVVDYRETPEGPVPMVAHVALDPSYYS
jgi:hypothetical protein